MSFYPSKIRDRIAKAANAGTVDSPDAVGTEGSVVCGSFASLSLRIDRKRSEILEARYRTNGCGYLVAACEALTASLVSRRLQDLHGTNRDEMIRQIAAELDPFPESRAHCAVMIVNALLAALANYRNSLIDEYRGERALICTCFGVDEDTIERCIIENGLTHVDDVIDRCRAGGGCGSCQPIIQEILDTVVR